MVITTPRGRVAVGRDPFAGGHSEQNRGASAGIAQLVGFNLYATYGGLYRTQPWLAAGVNKIARTGARLPLYAYRHGRNERLLPGEHQVADVLAHPRPGMSPFRWKEWMLADVMTYGNGLSRVMRDPTGGPTEIWPIPWPLVEVIGRREPEVYVYHSPQGPIPFSAQDAFHLQYWSSDLRHPLIGTSPIEPLRRTLMNEDAGARWVTAMFANAARPSGVVSLPADARPLTRDQLELSRQELEAKYGSLDNAFRIAILQGGATWQSTSMTVVEAALNDLRKLNRDEVAGVLDIPPPMLQITDRATFSNIDEQHVMMYQDTMASPLTLFSEEFVVQVIGPSGDKSVYVGFDLNEVLRFAPERMARFLMVVRRFSTIDELRHLQGLPAIGGKLGGSIWVPINEYPLSPDGELPTPASIRGDGTDGGHSHDPGDASALALSPLGVLLHAIDRAERTAASRLGGSRGAKAFDPERFARELRADLGRTDDPMVMWSATLARAVGDVIEGSRSPDSLRERMATLRAFLTVQDELEDDEQLAFPLPPGQEPAGALP